MASWLASVTADDPADRLRALASAPEQTVGVRDGQRRTRRWPPASCSRRRPSPTRSSATIRGSGAACGCTGSCRWPPATTSAAISSFNSVYGQLPGELAPKLALARACELGGEAEVAQQMYTQCARTDAAYVAPAQFGLARLAAAAGQRVEALAAFDRIPATSRAYGDARRQRALLLASSDGSAIRSTTSPRPPTSSTRRRSTQRAAPRLRIQILDSALEHVRNSRRRTAADRSPGRRPPSRRCVPGSSARIATQLDWPTIPPSASRLVDSANGIRVRSLT